MTMAGRRCARVSVRSRGGTRHPRTLTRSTRRHGTPSTDGPKDVAISGSACPRSICRARCGLTRPPSINTARGNTTRSYGYVWYPSVAVDWRPYYYGRWVTLRPYGWTWVGADPWAWPTHHYGRWGFSASRWFWIPGRSWGPAWVSWAYAPGYVSWCPLGFNNRAVLQFGFNFGYDPWRAWTVVPYRSFGVGYVNVHYVAGRTFDVRTRSAFVPRYTAPSWSGYAVPRSDFTDSSRGDRAPTRWGVNCVHESRATRVACWPRWATCDRGATQEHSRRHTRRVGVDRSQPRGGPRRASGSIQRRRECCAADASPRACGSQRERVATSRARMHSGSRATPSSARSYGAGMDRNQAGSPRLARRLPIARVPTPAGRPMRWGLRRDRTALSSEPGR